MNLINKLKIVLIFFFISNLILFSQTENISKSKYSIQSGLFGLWVNSEYKIVGNLSFKSEVGLEFGFGQYAKSEGINYYFISPSINLEPKFYYNFSKRNQNNKDTRNISANYFSFLTKYNPNTSVYSNHELQSYETYESFSFIPKWGIQRNIGNSNFQLEGSVGIGKKLYLLKKTSFYKENEFQTILDLSIRIGYVF